MPPFFICFLSIIYIFNAQVHARVIAIRQPKYPSPSRSISVPTPRVPVPKSSRFTMLSAHIPTSLRWGPLRLAFAVETATPLLPN